MKLRKKRLEDAIDDISSRIGGLDEQQTVPLSGMINYLLAENEILKEQLEKKGGKLDLSNTQRRKLAKRVKKLGRKGFNKGHGILIWWHDLIWLGRRMRGISALFR